MNQHGQLASVLPDPGVVGASIAVGTPNGLETAAWGETRHGTDHPMTPNTVLQIGSITKLYTATLVMQLVREGHVGLDEPLRTYLPEFEPKDADLAQQVTVAHLLCHTSGLQSDFVTDTGRGDDCLARFVEECATIGQGLPGAGYEYCNAGYVLLGRLVEKVTGETWDVALAARVLEPAGLSMTMTLPESVLLHENATGHFPTDEGWVTAPVWSVPRVGGPAGTICATAADVVHFVKARSALLDPAMVQSMQTPRVVVPGSEVDERCGLGWHIRRVGDREVVGHTGGNMGQGGMVWLDLATERVVCLLVNGLRDTSYLDRVLEAVL